MDGWLNGCMKRLFKAKWFNSLAGEGVDFWDNEGTNPQREHKKIKKNRTE